LKKTTGRDMRQAIPHPGVRTNCLLQHASDLLVAGRRSGRAALSTLAGMPPGQPLSLLWPHSRGSLAHVRLGDDAVTDLHVDVLVNYIVAADAAAGRRAAREAFARQVLTDLPWEPAVITHRQAVLTDLLEDAALRDCLEQVLPALEALGDQHRGERYKPLAEPRLERVAHRLAELELFVDAVVRMTDVLRAVPVRSDGFRSLARVLGDMRGMAEFAALERELPDLRARLASVRSLTLGVNLGPDLTPESATILELASTPVKGRRGLLSRLLGGGSGGHGLTPLQRGERGPLGRPNELVRDLQDLLGHIVAPIDAELDRFRRVPADVLSQVGSEVGLLLGVARLIERLRCAGLPVCAPECAPAEERCAELIEAYDPELALTQAPDALPVVTNDMRFDARLGRVWVLTGPNGGGKTTYTRAAGLAQVLFQAGMYVPARYARLSPVDGVHTHFPTREQSRPGLGRLDAEAERLATIFRHATPHSLILLNEALSGTSALEALDLARGVLRGLRLLGARAIYVTHLHELAASVDEINVVTPGDGVVASLIADSVEDDESGNSAGARRRTYRILPGQPRGVSFAAEIAEQHGISYPQLVRLLRERTSHNTAHR
jgi:DNA mismatch repair protein MutS